MRKEQIGDAMLILGDCREVMSAMPECFRVNAVITDPPYGIGYGKYESHIDDPKAYPELIATATGLAEGFVRDGWMCVFQAAKTAPKWSEWFNKAWRPIALPKTFVQILPTMGPTWATDYALLWPVGEPPQRGKSRDWFVCETSDMSKRPKGHPCPRPLSGIEHLVDALTEEGDTVIDPFLGSGTTGVACAKLGRKFVGIEIEPAYFEIACERIANAQRQERLFA